MNRTIITIITAVALLALPQAASAACPVGIANELATVPPATLAEGQTQAHSYSVTACTNVQKVTVEWVRIKSYPWLMNPANRETIIPETSQGTAMTGATSWTIPAGTPDGHYGVITRYYAAGYSFPEAQGASSFSVATPDLCANIAGNQQVVPSGMSQSSGSCIEPLVIVDPPADLCPNVDGVQASIPAGYTLIAGECKIVADPTGDDPTPLLPSPKITKRANVTKTTTGGKIRYTITVRNAGRGVLRAARTCDKIPAGTVYVSHTGPAAFAAGSLCVRHGNMVPGKVVRFTITVKVSGSFKGKKVTNTACVTSANAAKRCASATVKVRVIRTEPIGGVTG